MSGIVRNALRFVVGTAKHITNNTTKSLINSQCSRSMWHMGNRLNDTTKNSIKLIKSYNLCNCGCGRFQHTQVEEKLAKYLNGEIAAEKEATREKTIPSKLGKFDVSLDGAEVTLMKKENDETIKIIFNVNHTINSNENEAVDLEHALLSKPNFDVEITRGRQTLGFSCLFNVSPDAIVYENNNYIFGIDEVTLHEGERTDTIYAAGGEVIDGVLYDYLMEFLEDKGISNDFADEISKFSTIHEHNAYISLLEGLAKFTASK
ncbi:complement component 1 Q subcomponent-binding protein, mitochondrial-like [Aphidius gifuensis]|uniref:complement component 1 Q subcomponent-binding protein, mitochondrial-like n=1 Tax=Aphidius gifuensis TaxID=684658 RepID=UPI001CDBE15C|nr:complement component 1 Q subcomponent-binding protein, mitochondrial-like [Aphidius gifuensis]